MESFEQGNEVVAMMQQASRVRVPAEVSERAVARAMVGAEKMIPAQQSGMVGRVVFWAASLLVIGMLGALVFAPALSVSRRPAYGAVLQAAIKRSESYAGWVRVAISESKEKEKPADQRFLLVFFVDASGQRGVITNMRGERVTAADFFDGAAGMKATYEESSHVIKTSKMEEGDRILLKDIVEQNSTGLAGLRQEIAEDPKVQVVNASTAQDGQFERFEAMFQERENRPYRIVALVNRGDGFINSMDMWFRDGKNVTSRHFAYSYGGKGVKDLYEAGVPRDVKVVEGAGTRP